MSLRSALRGALREPLLHCVLAAAALYTLAAWRGAGDDDPASRRIVVDDAALVDFIQYRAKAFEPARFAAQLQALPAAERAALEQQYVEREVLYREALRRGLQVGDDVIRQRLIQRLDYVLEAEVAAQPDAVPAPADASLQAWYAQHEADYREPATLGFSHVYFDAAHRGDAAARAAAQALLPRLQRRQAGPDAATGEGDRFPYFTHYAERTDDYVGSHFDAAFAAAVAALPVGRWSGPLRSPQGWHLVYLDRRREARVPPLAEIRGRVLEDFQREQRAAARDALVRRLVAGYTVVRP
ncbi:MAG: hypothetical protein RL026_1653 [Pseudomonadota bacterium]